MRFPRSSAIIGGGLLVPVLLCASCSSNTSKPPPAALQACSEMTSIGDSVVQGNEAPLTLYHQGIAAQLEADRAAQENHHYDNLKIAAIGLVDISQSNYIGDAGLLAMYKACRSHGIKIPKISPGDGGSSTP